MARSSEGRAEDGGPPDCLSPTPNFFTAPRLARLSDRRQDGDWIAAQLVGPHTALLPVWRGNNLVREGSKLQAARVPASLLGELGATVESLVLLGELDGLVHFSVGLAAGDLCSPPGLERFGRFRDLRSVAPLVDHADGALLAYARAMTYWHNRHRFCGDCGSPTTSADSGHLRLCDNPSCGQQHFPRTDPAVIALVVSNERCLLGRKESWPKRMYSIIAGFVEPGESLEQAVAREVWEETGIRVCDVAYCSSQPWPFPSSLMLGFTARAISESIRLGDPELEDARWMSRPDIIAALREGALRLPSAASISFRLITEWFNAGGLGRLTDIAAGVPDHQRHS